MQVPADASTFGILEKLLRLDRVRMVCVFGSCKMCEESELNTPRECESPSVGRRNALLPLAFHVGRGRREERSREVGAETARSGASEGRLSVMCLFLRRRYTVTVNHEHGFVRTHARTHVRAHVRARALL